MNDTHIKIPVPDTVDPEYRRKIYLHLKRQAEEMIRVYEAVNKERQVYQDKQKYYQLTKGIR